MEINGQKIEKISGPISFTLLEPIKEQYDLYLKNGIKIPILILFGDSHQSHQYMCENCTGTCYKIYEDRFLKILNSISNKDYPVDYYLESAYSMDEFKVLQSGNIIQVENTNFPLKIMSNMRYCFYKEFKNNCPYPNIRWHLIDLRHTKTKKLEIDIYNGGFDKYEKYNYESKINLFLFYTYQLVKKYNNINDFLNEYNKLYSREECYDIMNMNDAILSDHFNWTTNFMNLYFNNPRFQTNSRIYKQINKGLISKDTWVQWFNNYYVNVIRKYNMKSLSLITSNNLKLTQTTINEFTYHLKNVYENNSFDGIKNFINLNPNFLERNDHIFRGTHYMFLDMYFITRLFKPPKDDIMSYLSFAYFGNAHTINITKFFTDIMGTYTVKENIENDIRSDTKRCLILPHINLANEVDKYL